MSRRKYKKMSNNQEIERIKKLNCKMEQSERSCD